jgi:hypothetical protein
LNDAFVLKKGQHWKKALFSLIGEVTFFYGTFVLVKFEWATSEKSTLALYQLSYCEKHRQDSNLRHPDPKSKYLYSTTPFIYL